MKHFIGHYETTDLKYFNLAKSHVYINNRFTLVLIQFMCTAYLLVFKHTNKKGWCLNQIRLKIDIFWPQILHSDWSSMCNLFKRLSRLKFHVLQRMFGFKFEFKVQCVNINTTKLERYIWDVSFSLYNVSFTKQ